MIYRLLIWVIITLLFTVPLKASAHKACDEILKDCIEVAEVKYSLCIDPSRFDPNALDTKSLYFSICESKGYKAGSSVFLKCLEDYVSSHNAECKKLYHKQTELCYSNYKKCRKGDIFGRVDMSISYMSHKGDNPFITGNASFTILGFWKLQPKESNEYIKNYRPDNLQIMSLLHENATDNAKNCPKLLYYYQGGGASVITLDRNLDYQQNPMGRFVLYQLPKPSKFAPKDFAKLVSPFYQVGSLGTIVSIEGKERAGTYPPECLKYNPAILKVRFGKFFISDNVKANGEMSGSDSWETCGSDAIEMGEDVRGIARTISFEIEKDKISISEGESHIGWPGKSQECPPGNIRGKVRVHWKFNLIK